MTEPHCFPFQIFPPRVIEIAKRYRFDEKLRDDPVECQKIYEELRVEAALLVIVRISTSLAQSRFLPLFRQNSPYAEVRAVVDNNDDPAMPASTFRAWFIGTIFVAAGYVDHYCALGARKTLCNPSVHLLIDHF